MSNLQKVFYVVDSFSASEQDVCSCKRDGEEVCTCPAGECHCNHLKFDTIYITLPDYFTQSNNAHKSISILNVKLFDMVNENEIKGSLHSDLVQINSSSDNYCCSLNTVYSLPPTFIIGGKKSKFECWCRDIKNKLIDLDTNQTRLVIELLLEF